MTKLLLVNNYDSSHRERVNRLRNSLRKNCSQVDVESWQEISSRSIQNYDGMVLSGAYDMLSQKGTQQKFSKEEEIVRDVNLPVLGVCFGHQLLGHAFGSKIVKGEDTATGYYSARLLKTDPLFDGLGKSIMIYEANHEMVQKLPENFVLLARGQRTKIGSMRHRDLPLYGVQFHPERSNMTRQDGEILISNFVKAVRSSQY